jgi:hypothetical protein
VKKSTVPKLPAPIAREADDRVLLMQVVDYYNELKQSPEALKYLESRGLKSSETIPLQRFPFLETDMIGEAPLKSSKWIGCTYVARLGITIDLP